MAEWPDADELAKVLNIDPAGDDWTVTLERVRLSAISWVKGRVGDWDEAVDEPDDNMAQAALRMAELMALRPETAAAVGAQDPTINRLLFGRRRKFGLA